MVQPYNYTLQVADPSQSFTEGIKLGEYFRQRQQAQAQQAKFQQLQAAYYATPRPTLQQTLQYASLLPKDQAELILKGRDAQNAEVTKSNINIGGQVLSSLMQGNKDQAISILRTRAEASKNSQDAEGQKQWEMMASTIEKSPSAEQAFKDYAPYMAALGEEGQKMLTSVYEAQKQPFEQRKAAAEAGKAESEQSKAAVEAEFARALQQAGIDEKTWNIKNLRSQISDRASRLKLDEQKVNAEIAEKLASAGAKLTELPESAQKLVNESAVAAATAKLSAQRFNTLAGELDKLPSSWGSLNSLEEWSRNQFGAQNFRSAIQAEYTRLANSAGIQAYKASGASGTMSDADLAVALDGIPKANANPATMARFMRGMAKMQDIDAALNGAKTDWLTQNRGQLGRSTKAFIAGDYSVKPGETYADFSSRVADDIAKKYAKAPRKPGAPISVTAPNGQVFTFASQQKADAFKKAAGIR